MTKTSQVTPKVMVNVFDDRIEIRTLPRDESVLKANIFEQIFNSLAAFLKLFKICQTLYCDTCISFTLMVKSGTLNLTYALR